MSAPCEICGNYQWDEEDECYYCAASCVDEDDYMRMMYGPSRESRGCPYYVSDDEYKIVRNQM